MVHQHTELIENWEKEDLDKFMWAGVLMQQIPLNWPVLEL